MKSYFILVLFLFLWSPVYAQSIDWTTLNSSNMSLEFSLQEEIKQHISPQVYINTPYSIDISSVTEKLQNTFPNHTFTLEWNLKSASSQSGSIFERSFWEKWSKELELIILETSLETQDETSISQEMSRLLFRGVYEILVYEKSFFLVYSDEVRPEDIKSYIDFSKQDGVFISAFWPLDKTDIENSSIMNTFHQYKQTLWEKSNYITLWGSRDFIFDIVSNLNADISKSSNTESISIIWLSAFNLQILQKYLSNFLSNKPWIEQMILLSESSKYHILKQNQFWELTQELQNNQQDFTNVSLDANQINTLYFISQFVNHLSNTWYSNNSIYIFLLIPFILTWIIFSRHFIWLAPIWIVIPLFTTLLFFKLWILSTLILIWVFLIINYLLSFFIDRYNLHYTPKMAFLISINIVLFILMINIAYTSGWISLNISDILYLIIWIILCEKIINILTSKDILEYKEWFFNTVLIAIILYGIFNIGTIKVFLLSYPELILILIPINFAIGKFSWLRVTEYFRFKEVIKSIEE